MIETTAFYYSQPGDGYMYQYFPYSTDPEVTRGIEPDVAAQKAVEADVWAIPFRRSGGSEPSFDGHKAYANQQKYPGGPNGQEIANPSDSSTEIGRNLARVVEESLGVTGLTVVICSRIPRVEILSQTLS